MKIFDKYVLSNFIKPLIATFFVVVFVLVMQALWLSFDDIAGKGIDLFFILKFLGYLALIVTPTALPIGVLLSSIMAMGNLAENYEYAAIKSAGISLNRIFRPLIFLILFLSVVDFVFLNNIYPWATLKQKNLYLNIKKKKPTLALVAGSFNTDIPGYSLIFEKKYGKDQNLLENVQIADLSEGKGKVKVITAKKGIITTEEGSKYMTLTLEDGNYYEEYVKRFLTQEERTRMPAGNATFKKYIINLDISSFNNNEQLNDENIREYHGMLNIKQLDSISKKYKITFDEYLANESEKFYKSFNGYKLHAYPDSLINKKIKPIILDNFQKTNKLIVINEASQILNRAQNINQIQEVGFKNKRKILNLYDFEFSYRISFALACLVLFFVGAPLGSLVRKGGFGSPMIMAIIIFVIYFFISQLGRNLSEESAISALLGSWLSTLILLPFGILLTRRATAGMGIFKLENVLTKIKSFFIKIKNKSKSDENLAK